MITNISAVHNTGIPWYMVALCFERPLETQLHFHWLGRCKRFTAVNSFVSACQLKVISGCGHWNLFRIDSIAQTLNAYMVVSMQGSVTACHNLCLCFTLLLAGERDVLGEEGERSPAKLPTAALLMDMALDDRKVLSAIVLSWLYPSPGCIWACSTTLGHCGIRYDFDSFFADTVTNTSQTIHCTPTLLPPHVKTL